MTFLIIAAGLVVGQMAPATPNSDVVPATTLGVINWEIAPAVEYPERALDRGVSGWARVSCIMAEDRFLSDCRTVGEEPVGLGFGASAVRASNGARVADGTATGVPANTRVAIRIPFQLGN